jgi:hypothetical protein
MPWLQWFDIPLKAAAVLLGGLWVLLNYYRGGRTSRTCSFGCLRRECFAVAMST